MTTPEHRRHEEHCERCRICSVGGQCRTARELLIDADAADWRRFNLAPEWMPVEAV